MRFPIKIVRIAMIVLMFSSIAIAYLNRSIDVRHLLSGDALYIPSLFRDIVLKGGNFFDWQFPGAPYFFPDIGFYFIIIAFIRNIHFAALIYGLLQLGIVYLLMLWLINVFPTLNLEISHLKRKQILAFRFDFSLFIFLYVILILVIQTLNFVASESEFQDPYFRMISSVYHYGNIINSLILIGAIIHVLRNKNRFISYIIIFLISVLGTSSDALFIITTVVPSILSLILSSALCKLKKLTILVTITSLSSGVFLGWSITSFIFNAASSRYLLREYDLSEQIRNLGSILLLSFEYMPIMALFLFVFYGIVAWRLFQQFTTERRSSSCLYLYSSILLSVILTFIALISNGILVQNYGVTRYFLNFYWFPVLFSWIVADMFPHHQNWSYKPVRNISFLMILILAGYTSFPKGKFYSEYYHPLVRCVDNALQKYEDETGFKMTNGIAFYDPSKEISEFSKRDLKIHQVQHDLSPFLWVNNITRYRLKYDFAVISNPPESAPDPDALNRLNGDPAYKYQCQYDEKAKVFVYGKDELRLKKFLDIGDSYTWKACELPVGESGEVKEDCSVTTQLELPVGHVTFGPYEHLTSGKYRFEIGYLSSAKSARKVGDWDVVVHSRKSRERANLLEEGALQGTDGMRSEVSDFFQVDGKYPDERIEVRTLADGSSDLTVFEITITKIS